jgi:FtsH-binding integral membrane protein
MLSKSTGQETGEGQLMLSKYFIMAVSIIVAAAAAIIVQKLLKSHVSAAVSQGTSWYVMWLCLYPSMKAWSRKPEAAPTRGKRPLTFFGWALIGLLAAIMVTTTYIWFP